MLGENAFNKVAGALRCRMVFLICEAESKLSTLSWRRGYAD